MDTQLERSAPALGLYRALSRVGLRPYRAKVLATAFVGIHVPLLALVGWFVLQAAADGQVPYTTLGVALAATLGGTALTLWVLNQLLHPVLLTSQALRAYRERRERLPLPTDCTDEVGRLMADADHTLGHLDAVLDTLAHVDEVTGLANRRRYLQRVASRIDGAQAFAVVVIRFVNLGRIADALDSRQAAQAVRLFADRLGRRADLGTDLARVGEAEFACVLEEDAADRSWVDAAGRLRSALLQLSEEVTLDALSVKPLVRAGLAIYPHDDDGAESLLDRAATSASQAVEAAPVVLHSATGQTRALERFTMEQELRRAVANDEFELHYQPVVDLLLGRTIGAEALIRWRHPQRGLIGPHGFIAAAEASGLIDPIGRWVLRTACAQLSEWNRLPGERMRVAVNLSARQFLDPLLKQHVLQAICEHHISPDQLEIELTETAAMADHGHTRRLFAALRAEGVRIALDDFGTGYASMSYLRNLPFDKLKIDREFVSNVDRVHESQAICSALIALAKGLGLAILAEGTETPGEVRFLQQRGCTLFQGYYFARPMPARDFRASIGRAFEVPALE